MRLCLRAQALISGPSQKAPRGLTETCICPFFWKIPFLLEPLFSSRPRLEPCSLFHVFLLPMPSTSSKALESVLSVPFLQSQCLSNHVLILAIASQLKSCVCVHCSVMSNTLWPRGLQVPVQPTRLLCPWNSPGTNTGVGCHFHLQGNLPWPRDLSQVVHIAGRFFTNWATRETQLKS